MSKPTFKVGDLVVLNNKNFYRVTGWAMVCEVLQVKGNGSFGLRVRIVQILYNRFEEWADIKEEDVKEFFEEVNHLINGRDTFLVDSIYFMLFDNKIHNTPLEFYSL